ncbi:hypothetical protein LVY72_22665 [Arthrobacter sp. I2-34]|uniref:Uncharacterized protein n=1 Tax=Arthrobacter hankyongi TaxID=2904801 RepID=A0ABS9LDQ0_9MICC|nr:hypothetical protein [Arthrobacter hankyongi]MCG2624696.1 hypothetical protein [Arthrobacter hankyongi]
MMPDTNGRNTQRRETPPAAITHAIIRISLSEGSMMTTKGGISRPKELFIQR